MNRHCRLAAEVEITPRVAADLKSAFPDMKGYSTRNLHYMRLFAEPCPEMRFVQQPAAQLPWFGIVTPLTLAKPSAHHPISAATRRQDVATGVSPWKIAFEPRMWRQVVATGVSPWLETHRCFSVLKGRHETRQSQFLSSLRDFLGSIIANHGLAPVATTCRPVGTETPGNSPRLVGNLNSQLTESAKLEEAIKANLKGLGYGE